MKYKTKHSVQLISYLKNHQNEHLNMQDIQHDLPDIPVATLYRLMDSLIDEGLVRKYIIGPNQFCCFQYSECGHEHHHFHLICEKCGTLIHLNCHEVNLLLEHIRGEHGFSVDMDKVNLYGLCEKCEKEAKL